jgi:ribonuclease VapC
MSDRYVLDASAILTVINGETGFELVLGLLPRATASAVNISEVVSKLQERGGSDSAVDSILADFDIEVLPFDFDQALKAGKLRSMTRARGLSLGDRACLALAASLGAIAVTTDKAWKDYESISPVMVVR